MPKQTRKPRHTMLFAIISILALLLIIAIIDSNSRLSESYYTISSAKLPAAFDGYRIVQISDLHNKQYGEDNLRLIQRIDNFAPDIVVLTGDMLSRNSDDFADFLPTAAALASKYPTYYITGNHERAFSKAKLDLLFAELTDLGVIIMDNKSILLSRGGESIAMHGLSYPVHYYKQEEEAASQQRMHLLIEQELGACDTSLFNLLLVHNPVYFETYCAWGADLSLSGHIHGGLIRLPFIGGVFGPPHKLFPTYDAGLFDNDNGQQMIVSRGLAAGIFGFRLFNRPDLVLISLQAEAD